MRSPRVAPAVAALVMVMLIVFAAGRTDAHKPITSPYTFSDDVLPIVEAKCGACHRSGGVAPMSLLTHREAVPWGASMKVELMAGHMPPWRVQGPATRFRNVPMLSARELNVLLTWASGGTPPGSAEKAPAPPSSGWALGVPDVVLDMPEPFTLAADRQEGVAEFTLAVPAGLTRLRAADLAPGTPSMVRQATISVAMEPAGIGGVPVERTLALWLPGDPPVRLDNGLGFDVPAGARLRVVIRYKKTWEHARETLTDRSRIGLYRATPDTAIVRALTLSPRTATALADGTVSASFETKEPLRALALYAGAAMPEAQLIVTAVRPDGSRETLIDFRPRNGWERRYWFSTPMTLPRGTRLTLDASPGARPLLPPGAVTTSTSFDASRVRLTLNVAAVP